MSILTVDSPNLDSQGGGFDAYDLLMYNERNTTVGQLESVARWSDVITASNRNFNGTISILLQRELFVDYIVMEMRLPPLKVGETICAGFGSAIIKNVSYLLGSSSSTEISLGGDSIFQALCSQVMSESRRNEMVRLMGQARTYSALAPEPNLYAYILIPTPFSSMANKLAIDTTLLFNNVRINISLNDRHSIYSADTVERVATLPTAFDDCQFLIHTQKLSNQGYSMSNQLQLFPSLKYNYPFTHMESFVSDKFTSEGSSLGLGLGQKCSVELNQFANADLNKKSNFFLISRGLKVTY